MEKNYDLQLIQDFQKIRIELKYISLDTITIEDIFRWKQELSILRQKMENSKEKKYESFISQIIDISLYLEQILKLFSISLIEKENLSIFKNIQMLDQKRNDLILAIYEYLHLFLEIESVIKLPENLFSYSKKLDEIYKHVDLSIPLLSKINVIFPINSNEALLYKKIKKQVHKITSFFENMNRLKNKRKLESTESKFKRIINLYFDTLETIETSSLITESMHHILNLFISDMINFGRIINCIKELISEESLLKGPMEEENFIMKSPFNECSLNEEKDPKKFKLFLKYYFLFKRFLLQVGVVKNEEKVYIQFSTFLTLFAKYSIYEIQFHDLKDCQKNISIFYKAFKNCQLTPFGSEVKSDLKKIEEILNDLLKICSNKQSDCPILKSEIPSSIVEFTIKQKLFVLSTFFEKYNTLKYNEKETKTEEIFFKDLLFHKIDIQKRKRDLYKEKVNLLNVLKKMNINLLALKKYKEIKNNDLANEMVSSSLNKENCILKRKR